MALKGMLDRVLEPRISDYNYGASNILKYNFFEMLIFDMWRYLVLAFPDWIISSIWLVLSYGTYYLFQPFFA